MHSKLSRKPFKTSNLVKVNEARSGSEEEKGENRERSFWKVDIRFGLFFFFFFFFYSVIADLQRSF